MAPVGSKIRSSHGRLHKRANSSSLPSSPPLPPAPEYAVLQHKYSGEIKRFTSSDEALEEESRGPKAPALKIKPYLRKLSSQDDNRIDLSRTTEENERLARLGMNDYSINNASRSVSDVTFMPVNGRSRHARTTSNGSQFSTNSSLQRPSAPYAQPMRHTPRPYTPPIAKSYTTSMMSEASDDPAELMMSDDYRQRHFESRNRTASIGSLPTHPPALHVHTSGSFTRLNASQSSIPSSLPAGGRSRGDTFRSIDSVGSPSSGRASLDKAVTFVRGSGPHSKSTDELDAAASRAASIRALRAAYNEKEEAKDRRAEKEALRLASKRARKEENRRRKSDATVDSSVPRPSYGGRQSESGNNTEKESFVGKAYNEYNASHARALPVTGPTRPRTNTRTSAASSKRGAKSTWLGFLAWFRTRLLRLGRKLHVTS